MGNRRRKGRPVSGWLCLDKDVGQTSTAAVGSIKRLFDAQKVGHAGTLDPLASGILPIALGDATKTVPYVQDSAKLYRFTVRWGVETDTDDAEGQVTETSETRPERTSIEAILGAFTGDIMQRPPAFSAIKIDGARAYDLAREGEAPELEERPVTIDRLTLTDIPDADHAVFEAECGKGTYVRSLARDIGRSLETFGHVTALRRCAVGPFIEQEAVTLEDLIAAREDGPATGLDRYLMPLGLALRDVPEITVSRSDASNILAGRAVILRGAGAPAISGPAHASHGGRTLALGEVVHGEFHPRRVFKG